MIKTLLSTLLATGILVMATGLPAAAQEKKEQAAADQVFASLDTNMDGKLSEAEFGQALQGGSEEQKKQAFAKWDTNGDKSISMEEFKANYHPPQQERQP